MRPRTGRQQRHGDRYQSAEAGAGQNPRRNPCVQQSRDERRAIQQALESIQFDQLVLETAGTPQTVALAIEAAGPRAQLALVGTLHHDLTLPAATFGQILRKELNIVGSWMNYSGPWPGEEWQTATRLLTEKRLQLAPLIAHRGDAESFARAVQALNGAPMQGKILLKLS